MAQTVLLRCIDIGWREHLARLAGPPPVALLQPGAVRRAIDHFLQVEVKVSPMQVRAR